MNLEKIEENITPTQITAEYREADIFPALYKYQKDHTALNLQKLCVEISEFCDAVYASTQNDEERAIFKKMVQKLNK